MQVNDSTKGEVLRWTKPSKPSVILTYFAESQSLANVGDVATIKFVRYLKKIPPKLRVCNGCCGDCSDVVAIVWWLRFRGRNLVAVVSGCVVAVVAVVAADKQVLYTSALFRTSEVLVGGGLQARPLFSIRLPMYADVRDCSVQCTPYVPCLWLEGLAV